MTMNWQIILSLYSLFGFPGSSDASLPEMASDWLAELRQSQDYLLSLDKMVSERPAGQEDAGIVDKAEKVKVKKVSGLWSYLPGMW